MAGFDFIGGLANTAFNIANQYWQNSEIRSLNREQRAHDERMWHLQNEWNKPSNQVKMLREAGINPAFALSNGIVTSGTNSTNAGGQSPLPYDFSPMNQSMAKGYELSIQSRLADANIQNMEQDSRNKMIRNKFAAFKELAELEKLKSESKNNKALYRYYSKQADYTKKMIDGYDNLNASQIEKNRADAQKAWEESVTESNLRELRRQQLDMNVKLSRAEESQFLAIAHKMLVEADEMRKNGVSQREIDKKMRYKLSQETKKIKDERKIRLLETVIETQGKAASWLPKPAAEYKVAKWLDDLDSEW